MDVSSSSKATKLYFRNNRSLTEAQIRCYFNQFGIILGVDIPRPNGAPSGAVFVEFAGEVCTTYDVSRVYFVRAENVVDSVNLCVFSNNVLFLYVCIHCFLASDRKCTQDSPV